MTKPSFAKINYLLRPNKNVERKLIVEALTALNDSFRISQYDYIGMGSMWFVDFILVHKILNIQNMISIEKEVYAKRADFNKPYDCITVLAGDTTEVLRNMSELQRQAIIWLDHDTGLNGPALEDARIICERAGSKNIFILTVKADHTELRRETIGHKRFSRLNSLKQIAGDLVPVGTTDRNIQKDEFPKLVAKMLFSHMKSSLKKSGRREQFYPLFNMFYSDGSPMVTVGGMIVNEEDKILLQRSNLPGIFDYVTGETQFRINVPHLTVKEKIELDSMLPRENAPTSNDIEEIGFFLSDDELKSYHKLYRYYPVFGEFSL